MCVCNVILLLYIYIHMIYFYVIIYIYISCNVCIYIYTHTHDIFNLAVTFPVGSGTHLNIILLVIPPIYCEAALSQDISKWL